MLLYEEKVPVNRAAFIAKVIEISQRLSINPNWLMWVMNFETAGSLDSKITNSIGATGLIQFMPQTAIDLGTTTDALRAMSNVDQLEYVFKYLNRYKAKLLNIQDVYLAVFFPAAMAKDDTWVIRTSRLSPDTIAKQNPIFDLDKNVQITVGEVKQTILSRIPPAFVEGVKKKMDSVTKFTERNWVPITLFTLLTITVTIVLVRNQKSLIKTFNTIHP